MASSRRTGPPYVETRQFVIFSERSSAGQPPLKRGVQAKSAGQQRTSKSRKKTERRRRSGTEFFPRPVGRCLAPAPAPAAPAPAPSAPPTPAPAPPGTGGRSGGRQRQSGYANRCRDLGADRSDRVHGQNGDDGQTANNDSPGLCEDVSCH